VDGCGVHDGAAHGEASLRRAWEQPAVDGGLVGRDIADRDQMEPAVGDAGHRAELGVAQPLRVLHDGVEDRLEIGA